MAKKKGIILLALVGIAAFYFLRRATAKILVGTPSLRVHRVTLSEIEFRIMLPILNQSDLPAPITGFLGQLLYNNSALGTISLVNPVEIPGFGQTTIEFKMVSGLFGAAYDLLNILTGGNILDFGNINYNNIDWSKFRITGTLKVGVIPVDINQSLLG